MPFVHRELWCTAALHELIISTFSRQFNVYTVCAWGDDALQSVPSSGYWRNKPLTEEKTVRSVHRKDVRNLFVSYFIEAAR